MVRYLSEKQRLEILMMKGYGDRCRTQDEVCELFNNKYPELEPITRTAVSKILRKFEDFGHVRDLPRCGRPKVSEDVQLDVLLDLQENPHKATQEVAANYEISKSSVWRTLKKYKWHPYKAVLVHELNEDDPDRRIEFCEDMMARCTADPEFVSRVLFSDEATFCLNGAVNRQNCRYWAPQNPHWMIEVHTQFPQKVNVWAGIVGDRILGPFFIEGTLTSAKYLDFLRDDLTPALAMLYPNEEDPDLPNNNLWYQQDGAPPHFSLDVRNYLNQVFPNRWIGRRGPIEWPARSPDLTPLDFFLWGYLKSKVYFNRPVTVDDLKNRIRAEIRAIRPETLRNVQQDFEYRLGYCQEVNGNQFEHLI